MEENPQRPLVLHTLPRAKDHSVPQQNASAQPASAQPQSALQPERDTAVGEDLPAEEPVKKKPKITRTTSTIPRLVSVVEIIKREYAKEAAKGRATENANDSSSAGLHQYNELSTLEDLGIVEQQEDAPDDAEQLRQALEGKNFLKQKLTPHLKVTLSVRAQPMLETRGATYQPPLIIKKTKFARARERMRQKKQEAGKVGKWWRRNLFEYNALIVFFVPSVSLKVDTVTEIRIQLPKAMRMNRNLPAPPPQPAVPSAEIHALRTNWKWAYLSHFLFTYNPVLHLEDIQLSELEADLASGTSEVIPTVMQRLLMSLTPHDKRMILDNWQQQLRKQSLKRSPDHNLMGPEEDPTDFASLIMSDKLDLFHALCEWQFHNPNNLRARMRDDDEYANWRMEPIAYDAKGNGYWLMGGNRLWIQYAPPRKRTAKSHKRKQPATTSTNGRKSAKRRQPATSSPATVIAAASGANVKSKTPALSATGRPIRETRSRAQQTGSTSRTVGTRVSSRLRGRVDEDIWQPIPEEWLKEAKDGADDNDPLARKESGHSIQAENENALKSLDDVSELTSLSDLSELPEVNEEETNDEEEHSNSRPTPIPELSSSCEEAWETVCVTLADWEEFPQRFEKSTHRSEKAFYKLLVNELVPAITEVLRVDVRKKVLEEAVVHRKRSSRIAVKESVREAERAEARRRAEEEKEMERHKRWEARARKEEEERIKRENLRSTRLREKGRTGSESVDVDILGSESENRPALTNGTGSGVHENVTTIPVKFVVNASKSGTHTPKDDDPWELDCEICHRRGLNLDDGQELMSCEKCNKWQHIRCHDQADFIAGRPRRNWELVDFLCAACAVKRQGRSSQQQLQRQNPGPQLWTNYNSSKINNGIMAMTSQPVPAKPAYNQASYETVPHSNGRTSYTSPLAPVQQTNATATPPTQYVHRSPTSTAHSVYPGATPPPRVLPPAPAPTPSARAPYPSGPNMYLSSSYSGGNCPPTQAGAQSLQPSSSTHYRSMVPVAPANAWSQQQVHYSQLASHQGAWNGTGHAAGSQPGVSQPVQQNGYYRPHPPPPVNSLAPPKHLPPAQQYYNGGPNPQS